MSAERIDPFTRTPGVAGKAMIDTHYADEIIQNFESEESSKFIYKIVGLRGVGKSVEYGKILNYFSEKTEWLVYTLSAAGNPIETLIAYLQNEKFNKKEPSSKTVKKEAEIGIKIIKGTIGIEKRYSSGKVYSAETVLTTLVQNACDNKKKILIGVDDISKTPEMVKFLSILGSMLLDSKKKVYFICTGLSKNIEDFSSESNLTFFKRSDSIEIKGLSSYEISEKYRIFLGVSGETSIELAKFVCGYAYAYQVLGSLYFKKSEHAEFEDLLPEFDRILSQDSYDLIWKSLTEAEKEMVKVILFTSTETSKIKENISHAANYDSLRDRLQKKHLINVQERGHIRIDLPRFKEFVQMWCM